MTESKPRTRPAGVARPVSKAARTPSYEESEKDLPLKVQMRRLFWSMGVSTSLDVKLRAYVSGDRRGPGWQEYTDLDVLGIGVSPAGEPHLMLADCKTEQRKAIERMFWIRGVADFFSADSAFLVRSSAVPAAARALSNRIEVGVLDPDDLRALARTYRSEVNLDGPLACLFDLESVHRQTQYLTGLHKKLDPLVDFVRFDYWIYEPFRNLTQVVAHLADAVGWLDPENPLHQALFFQAAWLYTVAIAHASHHVRTSRMADIPTAVQAYVAGGELAMREKGQLASLLNRAGINVDARTAVLPPYVDLLCELVARQLHQPAELIHELRYAEYLTCATIVGEVASVKTAFTDQARPFAAKLLADVCGFLVTAAGLRPEFRTMARRRLTDDLLQGRSSATHELQAESRRSEEPDAALPLELPES